MVDFFHAVNFPYYRKFRLNLWSFFEHLSFQTALDLCPNVHPTIQMSETNTAYVQIGQEDCILPVAPSACPRTRKSLVQVWTVYRSFFLFHIDSAGFRGSLDFHLAWKEKQLPSHHSSLQKESKLPSQLCIMSTEQDTSCHCASSPAGCPPLLCR